MEVAKLVTQPFCRKIHVSLTVHFGVQIFPLPIVVFVYFVALDSIFAVAEQGEYIAAERWVGNLRGPRGFP